MYSKQHLELKKRTFYVPYSHEFVLIELVCITFNFFRYNGYRNNTIENLQIVYLIKFVVSYVEVICSNILNFSAGFRFRRLLRRLVHVDGRRVDHPALDEGFHVDGLLIIFVITAAGCASCK